MFYSIIVPVYNRPDEIDELLNSLCYQSYPHFEVLIIEDGSTKDCKSIVDAYTDRLTIRYYVKENTGQGFSRNFGFDRARGDYFIVFDSDCLIPPHYLECVTNQLQMDPVDVWGGPDRAHPNFSAVQKAISYSMTSPLTTGGIRGGRTHFGTFHPRSFNMGISREVYQKTGGYQLTRMGEDIEFSIRVIKHGFRTALFPDAYVYHKRRTTFRQFYRQLHFFGRARINIWRYHPEERKLFHWLPSIFLLYLIALTGVLLYSTTFLMLASLPLIIYFFMIFLHALWTFRSIKISTLAVVSAVIQLTAYGTGFLSEFVRSFSRRGKA